MNSAGIKGGRDQHKNVVVTRVAAGRSRSVADHLSAQVTVAPNRRKRIACGRAIPGPRDIADPWQTARYWNMPCVSFSISDR